MRDFSVGAFGVSLGLSLNKIRRYFRPDSPWEKAYETLRELSCEAATGLT